MNIVSLTQQDISDFFLSDVPLIFQSLPDDHIRNLLSQGIYPLDGISQWLGVIEGNNLLANIAYNGLTDKTVCLHVRVHTWLQRKKIIKEILNLIEQWFKENTPFTSLCTFIPSNCINTWKTVEHFGFSRQGCLFKAVCRQNITSDLYIYQKGIKDD